jgi:DNA-binding Lrp family transcriptional regulator
MASLAADPTDRRLLVVLQRGLPLTPRPFAAIAAEIGLSEDEVLTRVRHLKDGRRGSLIREIGPIFDTRALGYRSTLVAMAVPEDRLDGAAGIVNAHPGVSHNYQREHRWNLWFTLAVPPAENVETTVKELVGAAGGFPHLSLPALRTFKIGVRLGLDSGGKIDEVEGEVATSSGCLRPPDARDKAFIRTLQQGIKTVAEPFAPAAQAMAVSTEELLEWMREAKRRGWLRRFAAVLHHRQAGYSANGMVVWKVPEERVDEVAAVACRYSQVSHCYERSTCPGWPYSLFTMVHSLDRAECRAVVRRISGEACARDLFILFSSKEHKKERIKYFV